VDVENVGDTTRHTGSEVAAGATEHNNATTSHVLAAVVTDTLNDGSGSGVTDGETLGSDTAEKAGTGGGTVQAGVADEDVLLSLEDGGTGRVDDESTTRETLSDVIVGVTLKLQSHTGSKEGTEGLTGRTLDVDMDSVHGQSSLAVALGDVVRQGSTHGTVGVDNVALDTRRETLVESQLGLGDELVVQADIKLVVLLADIEGSNTGAKLVSRGEEERQVDVARLAGSQIIAALEHLDMAHHLVDRAETKLGHDGTELVGDIIEEVDDVLGRTSELLPELRILSGDTDRASVLLK